MQQIIEQFTTSFFGGFVTGVLVVLFFIKVVHETVMKLTKPTNSVGGDGIPDWMHCFECENEMPVKKLKNNGLCCKNCGLIHR